MSALLHVTFNTEAIMHSMPGTLLKSQKGSCYIWQCIT